MILVDIGIGEGVGEKWKKVNPKVIGFDLDGALYSKKTILPFYFTERGGASIYKPNFPFVNQFPNSGFKITRIEYFKTDTLDNQVKDADFIKIDTEGSELEILKGGKELLRKVSGIEVEVSFNPMYEGQPLFSEIDAFLREQGFQLFDLHLGRWKRHKRSKGQVVLADAVYFRENSPFKKLFGF